MYIVIFLEFKKAKNNVMQVWYTKETNVFKM